MSNQVDVLIVGAGAAGLTAAYDLLHEGFDVKILEASDSIGGRLKKNSDFTDFPIDLGAEFIHVNPEVLNEILWDYNTDNTNVLEELDITAFDPEYNEWWDYNNNPEWRTSSLSGDSKFVDYTWFDYFNDYVASYIREKETESGEDIIITGCQVTTINEWDDDSEAFATVLCEDDSQWKGRNIIVTAPISILQDGDITFSPSLPDNYQKAIDNVRVMPGVKVWMRFDTDFYFDAFGFARDYDNIFFGERLFYDATFGQTTTDNILGMFAVGDLADDYVELSDQEIVDDILAELDTFFDNQATSSYIDSVVQNWSTEPFILGAYTNDRSSCDSVVTLNDPIGKLSFAGEAIPANVFDWGFAQQAAFSGRRAAAEISGADVSEFLRPDSRCDVTSPCLSSYSTVRVRNGMDEDNSVHIRDLEQGTDIMISTLSSEEKYQQVYAFGHKSEYSVARFLQIQTSGPEEGSSQDPLEISGEHLLYKLDLSSSSSIPVRADSIQVGDFLMVDSNSKMSERVTKITHVDRQGLYSPLTKDGSFLASGIRVSSFTAAGNHPRFVIQSGSDTLVPFVLEISHHFSNQVAIAPFHFLCVTTGFAKHICEERNAEGQLLFAAMGEELVSWTSKAQPIVLLVLLIGMLPFYVTRKYVDSFYNAGSVSAFLGMLLLCWTGTILFKLFIQKWKVWKKK